VSFDELKSRQLTTDRDGSVIDCYGFRRLGPVRDPLWTGPRPLSVNVPDDSADEPVTSPSPVEGAGGLTARPPAKARLHLVDGEYPNQEVTTTAITA